MYKLSPSDFKYLWEDCKHCYYRKVKQGIYLPSIGMPGVFGKMNDLVQTALLGKNLHELHPDLPAGTFDRKERQLRSIPIPNTEKSFINGRFDLLTKFEDRTHGVIDLKITDPKSEDLYKFSTQLHAYKFALENPAPGKERMVNKISKMGLLIMSLDSVEFVDGKAVFYSKPQWVPFNESMDSFFSFIDEIAMFLDGPMPAPTDDCDWCKYRALINNTNKTTDDIPF